jgi:hypothetical protein
MWKQRMAVTCGLAAGMLLGLGTVPAVPTPSDAGTVRDRAAFIPKHRYPALKDTVVGLLVGDVLEPLNAQEGGSGPTDGLCFTTGGSSYRWVYVPVGDNAGIPRLDVRVGERGKEIKWYRNLDIATPATVKRWGIREKYALVELEVNDGKGAPAERDNHGFVATRMKQLDGTKEYPLHVADVVAELRQRYHKQLEGQEKTIDRALDRARKAAVGDRAATGPRETEEAMYLTWLAKERRLVVRFRTTVHDGAFKFGGDNLNLETGRRGSRYGTAFGIEFGTAYEVSRSGKLERTRTLPIQPWQKDIPKPAGFGDGGPARR